jgi:phosphatidylglycerophosphatase A
MTAIRTKTRWAWAAATVCGVGYLPLGPGTWASLAATLLWFFLARALHPEPLALGAITALAALAATLLGIPAGSIVERESGAEDPGYVVLDEVAGQWTALVFTPLEIRHAVLAFALFRLFDITKPWPARRLERLHGGAGIMLDDIAAGLDVMLAMLLIRRWW